MNSHTPKLQIAIPTSSNYSLVKVLIDTSKGVEILILKTN